MEQDLAEEERPCCGWQVKSRIDVVESKLLEVCLPLPSWLHMYPTSREPGGICGGTR